MTPSKIVYFIIELLNCYAAVYYSNFLFFYTRSRFGFGEMENLLLAAFNGLVYTFAAWRGGAFAQRHGCTRSLYVGFSGMATAMVCGLLLKDSWGQVLAFGIWTVAVCFVWPALEALVSEGVSGALNDMVGMYNVTWAFGGSLAYFSGGLLLERLGMQSLFLVPLCIVAIQVPLTPLAAKLAKREKASFAAPASPIPPPQSRSFLHMAWLANPLSYVAINTVIPTIPSIAVKLHLSTGLAGIICSTWMFSRLFAFVLLWRWTWWHYRFRFLAVAFALMVAGFAGIILAKNMPTLMVAQICFGISVGLIYYSSLYYSLNASSERGAHGGLHEAMIGAGLFVGPACGACSLLIVPAAASGGVMSVGGLLAAGFAGLLWMKGRQSRVPQS
jgi:predicted MFS family arabinose efflux permease